jgi:hypothetical protein
VPLFLSNVLNYVDLLSLGCLTLKHACFFLASISSNLPQEWKVPPHVVVDTWTGRFQQQWLGGIIAFIIKRGMSHQWKRVLRSEFPLALLIPFNFYPGVGILVAAWFKALGTAHNLHKQVGPLFLRSSLLQPVSSISLLRK